MNYHIGKLEIAVKLVGMVTLHLRRHGTYVRKVDRYRTVGTYVGTGGVTAPHTVA